MEDRGEALKTLGEIRDALQIDGGGSANPKKGHRGRPRKVEYKLESDKDRWARTPKVGDEYNYTAWDGALVYAVVVSVQPETRSVYLNEYVVTS